MVTEIKKVFLLVTGFITCPCHLPFVLPALAAGLAGTTLGTFISEHTGLLIALATAYFVGVVVYFLRSNTSAGRNNPPTVRNTVMNKSGREADRCCE